MVRVLSEDYQRSVPDKESNFRAAVQTTVSCGHTGEVQVQEVAEWEWG